jgi:hypothetical protein
MFNTRIRLDKATEGGGGTPGTVVSTEDINLSDKAFEKLGLPPELRKTPLANGPQAQKSEGGSQKAEDKPKTADDQQAAETAEAELKARAEAAGKTVDELRAEEEQAATAETERLTAKAAELGKTVEEVQALEAEEAAQSAPPELNAEQTEYVHALVAQHEETLNAEKARADQAEAKARELEGQLQNTKRPPVQVMGIHPMFLANNEAEINQAEQQFAEFEKWALANWDGSQAVEARGDQPAMPAFTAEQVRARYAEVKEQRAKLVPAAKQALQVRAQIEANAKAIYPALFDSARPESKVVSGYLSNYPELRAIIPNFHIVAGDAIVGEKLRGVLLDPKHKANAAAAALLNAVPELKNLLAAKPAAATAGPGAKPGLKLPPKPLAKTAGTGAPGKVPRPGGGGAAAKPALKTVTGPSAKTLGDLKRGGLSERDALTQMISGISLPTLAPKNANAE